MLFTCTHLYKSHGIFKYLLATQQNTKYALQCLRFNSKLSNLQEKETITLLNKVYTRDELTNITPRVTSRMGKGLHSKLHHPLQIVRKRIENFFYSNYRNRLGTPLFAVFDDISPVVTVKDNFDSLLFPADHVGRQVSDSYYVNRDQMLRAHTTAHQSKIIGMGCDAFLCVGDVYRRDEIDASHYPVFHQIDSARLFTREELFSSINYKSKSSNDLEIFDTSTITKRSYDRQELHTLETAKLLEYDLKKTLTDLTKSLFGKDIEYRWVTDDVYFPFTHPSWELEILFEGDWMEVLGAGVIEQKILNSVGVNHKVGWAFGLGLERLAMKLFSIPDIRLFWSEDEDFTRQFVTNNINAPIVYKPISQYPACINDLSFWIDESFEPNDFFDLVRSVAGDIVQQVKLIDEYKKGDKISHCYKITYRHMEKTFTQEEVNDIHDKVSKAAVDVLHVELR